MRRQLLPAVVAFLLFTLLTGVAYPLAVTGIAQVAASGKADGSLVTLDGRIVGSRLIAQAFAGPGYFHPRPSANDYDGTASGPSNLGPTNPELLDAVGARIASYRALNGLGEVADVPVDAVTSSASGLDPHISPANARLQAPRVARARGLALDHVLELVTEHTEGRALGFLGEPGVNVLALNISLDSERR